MTNLNERNKDEIGEYVVFLVESGYAEWDESVGAYVFVEGVDASKVMKDYRKEMKRKNLENTG